MENADSILQSLGALFALLLSGFAMFKVHQSSRGEKESRKGIEKMATHAHKVIEVEAEEDHQEVTEALSEDDPSAAIAALFNDRND